MDDITPDLLDIDELESEETLFRELRITADKGQAPVRIDKFLVDHVAHTSRNKIQQAADAGSISVNGKVVNNPINLSGENKLRPISTAFILEKDDEDLGDKSVVLNKLK